MIAIDLLYNYVRKERLQVIWLWMILDSLQRWYCRIAALTDLLIFLNAVYSHLIA